MDKNNDLTCAVKSAIDDARRNYSANTSTDRFYELYNKAKNYGFNMDNITLPSKMKNTELITVVEKVEEPERITVVEKVEEPDEVSHNSDRISYCDLCEKQLCDTTSLKKHLQSIQHLKVVEKNKIKVEEPERITVVEKVEEPERITVVEKVEEPEPITVVEKVEEPERITVVESEPIIIVEEEPVINSDSDDSSIIDFNDVKKSKSKEIIIKAAKMLMLKASSEDFNLHLEKSEYIYDFIEKIL